MSLESNQMPAITKKIIERSNNHFGHDIAVIGGGIVGSTTALELATLGYQVELFDPNFSKTINYSQNLSGSHASLGVLMGYVFKRNTGRSWLLRKRSMELWPHLISKLKESDNNLKIFSPLIQLARSEDELKTMSKLIKERKNSGLELLSPHSSNQKDPAWPSNNFGGLVSNNDGRINPLKVMSSLMKELEKYGVKKTNKKVSAIKRIKTNHGKRWQLNLDNEGHLNKKTIVICSAATSEELIKPLGYDYPIQPVLGQAIKVQLSDKKNNWSEWPAVLTITGMNLIPQDNNHLIIGATLEAGELANEACLKNLLEINGLAPYWLKDTFITNSWKGIRFKPTKEPAPLLKDLEPGLILNTAHYRNGFLLAPACAEWVGQRVHKDNE